VAQKSIDTINNVRIVLKTVSEVSFFSSCDYKMSTKILGFMFVLNILW